MTRMKWDRPRRQPGADGGFNLLAHRAERAERAWKGGLDLTAPARFVGIDPASGPDRTVEVKGSLRDGVLHVEQMRVTLHASALEATAQLRGVTRATVHCDGCCEPNPGRGGWGLLVDSHTVPRIELCGGAAGTTNNAMELTGAIVALQVLPAQCAILIISDSQYLVKGATAWLPGWKRRGWRTAEKKPVANIELWRQLDALATGRPLTWKWVKGHNGHHGNERADLLASIGRDQNRA